MRRHLMAPVLVGAVCAAVMLPFAAPRYAAEALLRVEGRLNESSRSRVQVIASREFARQILADAGLTARLSPPQETVRLAGLFGAPRSLPVSRETQALREIEANLTVVPLGEGRAAISYVATDPRLAADVANAFADGYLKLQQTTTAFSMNAQPAPAAPRVLARAEPAGLPLLPHPWMLVAGAGVAGFLLAFALQALARRRATALTLEPVDAVAAPAPQGHAQHLPWIGSEAEDDGAESEAEPRRRVSRDGELADLTRLVELRGPAAGLVVVTGLGPEASAADCALALGRSLAVEKRVVIVCLDVAAPQLDGLTADPRAAGLTDLLFGVASFSDVIHRETASRCHVIPPGRGAREAGGLVAADRLALILGALERTYDHVVVAAPPLGEEEGAGRLAALQPTLILVTRPGGLATDAVQAFDRLASWGFGDIAMITFTQTPPAGFSQAA
ncbi:lipopolysaccharide biosynthesis protein [Ancylobacter sp. A5.8]|uniref:tyrosine-protein kinase family protein n=1 Tax=Ancylobacter gelatini TaxID=2919920 RepID=UPI001F4E31E6|nr:lipopolysaccharide biosynthesis protein [Ancylobacter gelatini]MCJ8141621.1 lipopolysaccharide biosynthesis protein [Ancylobacter gelatini]